jgi:hypothetical protein
MAQWSPFGFVEARGEGHILVVAPVARGGAGRSGPTSESRLRKGANELSCNRANERYRGQSLTPEVSVSEELDAKARGD